MNPNHAKNEREILSAQVKFLKFSNWGLMGLSLLLVAGWITTVVNQTTIIVPPEVHGRYELGSNFANKDYLSDVANYVLSTVLTVTPDSVDYNTKVILKMTHPDSYPKLSMELGAASLRVKKDRITTVWTPKQEAVYEREKRVHFAGTLKTFIGDTMTSVRDKEYTVAFAIQPSGKLYIQELKEVVKETPGRPAPASSPAN